MTADDPASLLPPIRERAETASKIMVSWKAQIQRARASAADVPALLKAVDAALKLADDWDAEAADLTWQITPEDCGAAQMTREHALVLRADITTALAGAQPSEDENHG